MRVVIIFAIVILLFGPFNWLTVRQLLRLHPRRRAIVIALAIAGNVMWLFFPILNARTDFSRWMRAIFGPPWFAWTSFAIVYSMVIFTLLIVWLPFARRVDFIRFARRPSRVSLWSALIALVAGAYGALVPLRIERVRVAIENLPPSAEGMRIVLAGDLHVGLFSRPSRLQQIFSTIDELHPDLVVLAGDLVDDDPVYAPKLLAATRFVAPSTPIVAVLGNHEMYGAPREMIDRLRGSRVRLLVNEGLPMRGLWLTGISDYAARVAELQPNFPAALARRPANAMPIVLAHQPRAFDDARRLGIPLTLCAHSHGGQCGFRPLRWSLAGLFLRYHMGLYREGNAQLFVHTGAGYWLLPWRLGITPEVVVIELSGVRRQSRRFQPIESGSLAAALQTVSSGGEAPHPPRPSPPPFRGGGAALRDE